MLKYHAKSDERFKNVLNITKNIKISPDRLTFSFSRSSGPGGQNVNKLNTRVTALFDIVNCPDLTQSQKNRIITRLRTRICKNGILRVTSQEHRTQTANKKSAADALVALLRDALKIRPLRKKTRVPRSAIERRLAKKKRDADIKKQRSAKPRLDD
jgi:ribosome-associated protein